MKHYITGSTGFLGRHLIPALRERGEQALWLTSRQWDLQTSLLQSGSDADISVFLDQYDVIWHLAAHTQAGTWCLDHQAEQWLVNQRIHASVLNWWRCYQHHALLVSIGTSCTYPTDRPLVESNYLKGEPYQDLYTYAMTKRMLQVGVQAMHAQDGMNWLTLVPSTLYGPGYRSKGQSHFIFDVIKKVLKAKDSGKPPVFWGDGYQVRELVFVDDFIKAALALVDAGVENEIVNVGFGQAKTLRGFVREVCAIVEYDGPVEWDESKYVGAKSKVLDSSKLASLVSVEPTPLVEGLGRTIRWMMLNET